MIPTRYGQTINNHVFCGLIVRSTSVDALIAAPAFFDFTIDTARNFKPFKTSKDNGVAATTGLCHNLVDFALKVRNIDPRYSIPSVTELAIVLSLRASYPLTIDRDGAKQRSVTIPRSWFDKNRPTTHLIRIDHQDFFVGMPYLTSTCVAHAAPYIVQLEDRFQSPMTSFARAHQPVIVKPFIIETIASKLPS